MKSRLKSPIFLGLLLGGAGFIVNGDILPMHGGLALSLGGMFYLVITHIFRI